MVTLAITINSYGLVASAVTGIGLKLGQCAMIVTNALNTAVASMIGQNFGARKPGRVAQTVYVGLLDGVRGRIGLSIWMGMGLGMGIWGFWLGDALAGFIPFLVGCLEAENSAEAQ